MAEPAPCWPPFGLTLTTPRLILRPVRDGDIPAAVEAALSGIHEPGRSPFSSPWLRRSAQGRGFDRKMRAAVALYAFDWLGAEVAESEAAAWNQQSLGVSRSLGYQLNGITRAAWGGKAQEVQKMRLTPATLNRPDWQLKVEGHEATAKYLRIGS